MITMNGLACMGMAVQDMHVSAVKPPDDMMMPASFASGPTIAEAFIFPLEPAVRRFAANDRSRLGIH